MEPLVQQEAPLAARSVHRESCACSVRGVVIACPSFSAISAMSLKCRNKSSRRGCEKQAHPLSPPGASFALYFTGVRTKAGRKSMLLKAKLVDDWEMGNKKRDGEHFQTQENHWGWFPEEDRVSAQNLRVKTCSFEKPDFVTDGTVGPLGFSFSSPDGYMR